MDGITAEFAAYVADLVQRGGPRDGEDSGFTSWVDRFDKAKQKGIVSETDRLEVLEAFGDAVSLDTMQGMVVQQPHGYAGDYETIDRIYASWMSPRPDLINWDRYFHAQAAPKAVRNRKAYFHGTLDELQKRSPRACVLNLGAGPGRCMLEWLDANCGTKVTFDCTDVDKAAVAYARKLTARHSQSIAFHERNVLRYRPTREYDLVWAGGLFDYFDDRMFVAVARRMLSAVARGGQLVIGNFAVGNPSRAYMELGGWVLHHRTPSDLEALMVASGAPAGSVRVGLEPEGVNLFVHVSRA